ncbi:MAG: glycosyltransferase family 2 protein [Armatimonadetes bacterium]|jgi:glycosyltransferase involved in cell wall biosynthesis|nr:glycosyltransferase family 2 protein [Armatimonadota bacterium]
MSVDLSVLVPALNEEDTIAEVVNLLLKLPLKVQVIVINDGSTDRTGEILAGFGDQITLLTNPKPQGKGAAIVSAIPSITGEVTIIQDADLEYFPDEIPKLVEPILKGEANVVYGSRFFHGLPKGMALPNKIVNKLLAWSVGLLFFRKISDEATCYKAFRSSLLRRMNLECKRFEFCPEATAKAIRLGERIVEIPIRYVPRSKAAGKKIRWTDAPEAFWTLLKHRFKRF